MYDYMQALQEKFFSDDLYAKQRQEIETIRCKLSHTLDKQQRKQLLQLVDAESQLRDGMALDLALIHIGRGRRAPLCRAEGARW